MYFSNEEHEEGLLEVEDESGQDLVYAGHHQDFLPGEKSLLAVLARQHLADLEWNALLLT